MISGPLGFVDHLAGFSGNLHLLGVHLVLGEVFHLDVVEVAQAAMKSDIGKVDAVDFHAFQQFAAEMQSCGRSRDSPFVLGKNSLEVVHILRGGMVALASVDNITGQRRLTEGIEILLELIVRTVIEEAERASTARGVVDDLGHHGAGVVEKEFVADTNLPGRLHEHVP